MTVNYPIAVDSIDAGEANIRCLLLLWTGDYPAQSEVGKFLCKGTQGCRIDNSKGMVE